MDKLKATLNRGSGDLMKQYVLAIMATGTARARAGRDLLAKDKISVVTALTGYYLPKNPTPRDISMLIKDIEHFIGKPRQSLFRAQLGF